MKTLNLEIGMQMSPRSLSLRTLSPRTLALPVLALSLCACESRITGNEGLLSFSYPADDDVVDFNKPLAPTAFLDLDVEDVDGRQPVTITAASTDDDAVMTVVSFEGSSFKIQGVADGSVLISVTATNSDGEELEDSVNMNVRTPEELEIRHTCIEGDTAAYLVNSEIWLPFDMWRSNRNQAVIGYGYYPVTVSDAAAFDLQESSSTQANMRFKTGPSAAEVTLTSELADGSVYHANVVTQGDVDGVADPLAFVVEDIDVGETYSFYVLPKVGEVTVCQANMNKTVASNTPDICRVEDRAAEDGSFELGWFEVEGLAAGTCEYTVTYPAGNGGEGASATFTYEIQP